MVNDDALFTLGSLLALPITDGSTIRILRRIESGTPETLWMGSFKNLCYDIHKLERINVYTEIKSITMGLGNQNALIIVK